MNRRFWFYMRMLMLLLMLPLGVLSFVVAQEPAFVQDAGDASDVSALETNGKAEHAFAEFAKTAESFEFRQLGKASSDRSNTLAFEWESKPLFRFASEGTVFGSVYVWHDRDHRLAILGTIGSLPINGVDMEFIEFHLLKPEPIEPIVVSGFPTKRWNPSVDDLAIVPVDEAPQVGPNERMRLVQMRSMARRFGAEMVENGQVNQLRLLPQPIYRYAASTAERDGALFAFVWDKGTDPELILRIESLPVNGEAVWHFQAIRFTWREVGLSYQRQPIWRAEEFVDRENPTQTTPYLTGLTKRLPE